ncbi:cellulase family glycosylhydrolase [Candidatus Saccharibacteria bacterium]|jgi:glucan 1,3-beta-glucosidase|nr:cellulase family glycosylhydrolase [Candidatus Saccharibacteria bacterium]
MKKPIKGVNLGGWLVVEKWMTPSLFTNTDADNEYELTKTVGGDKKIHNHHQTFITESDIAWLSRVGIEVVRVPIGFWILHGYYDYVSARDRLDWLFEMSKKYKIKVLLCLHAAPGAQNNNDHSGSGRPGGIPGWYSRLNRLMTRNVLIEIANLYGKNSQLWGIELLNEPNAPNVWYRYVLWFWVRATMAKLKTTLPSNVRLVVSDSFDPGWWSGKIDGATLDIHHYQCFSDEHVNFSTVAQHKEALAKKTELYRGLNHQPKIIGEWSAALPSGLASDRSNREFCEAQLDTSANVDAWFFWSYKTEGDGHWNFRYLYEQGYFKGHI